LTPLATVTSSGLKVWQWVLCAVSTSEQAGHWRDPLLGDELGNIVRPKTIKFALMDKLQIIKDSQLGLIPEDLDVYEDFGISRSFRRGATSTTRTRGVEDKHVYLVNRWRSFENARRQQPTMSMHDHLISRCKGKVWDLLYLRLKQGWLSRVSNPKVALKRFPAGTRLQSTEGCETPL